jgi:hypothetical protein
MDASARDPGGAVRSINHNACDQKLAIAPPCPGKSVTWARRSDTLQVGFRERHLQGSGSFRPKLAIEDYAESENRNRGVLGN